MLSAVLRAVEQGVSTARPVEKIRDDGLTVYEHNLLRSAVFSHLVPADASGPKVLTHDPHSAV